jgi:hypothetical protein
MTLAVEHKTLGYRFTITKMNIENPQYFQGTSYIYGTGWTPEDSIDEALDMFAQSYPEETKNWTEGQWNTIQYRLQDAIYSEMKGKTVTDELWGWEPEEEDYDTEEEYEKECEAREQWEQECEVTWHCILKIEKRIDQDNWEIVTK